MVKVNLQNNKVLFAGALLSSIHHSNGFSLKSISM